MPTIGDLKPKARQTQKYVFALAKITELENQKKEILKFCTPHLDQMWAARVVSILLDCDFRDAQEALKQCGKLDDN